MKKVKSVNLKVEEERENLRGGAMVRNWGGEGNPSVSWACGSAACKNLRHAISLSHSLSQALTLH